MLVLFHDVTDPTSAVAVARCTRLAADGVPIEFEGFESVGLDVTMPVDLGVLARLDGLAEEARSEGIVLRRPPAMPPTGPAHVLLGHAETTPLAAATRSALYAAYWRDGRDIADHDVLLDVATTAGLDPEVVEPLLADRVALAQRRRQMATHRRDGVGGVPVILASRTLVPGLMTETQLREMAAQT